MNLTPGRTGQRSACAALAVLLLSGILAGCGGNDGPAAPGAMTEGEAAALEDASEMLDTREAEPIAPVTEGAAIPSDSNE